MNGNHVSGEYKELSCLGDGILGTTYLVLSEENNFRYALKKVRPLFFESSRFQERWESAFARLQAIPHSNLTSLIGTGVDGESVVVVMDLAPGDGNDSRTLFDLIRASDGKLDELLTIQLLSGVLRGTAELHENGCVHGNLKPENILLYRLPDQRVVTKVTDAIVYHALGSDNWRRQVRSAVKRSMKRSVESETRGSLFRSLMRTRSFMSPELQKTGEATFESDVYALGLLFYRVLTGRQLGPRPPSYYNPVLSRDYDRFILKALEQEPGDRYHDATEMLEALDPIRELMNRMMEQKRRIEVSEKVRAVRDRADALQTDGRLEEALELLWNTMQEYPGRQDILNDYSALEETMSANRRQADREEQYHWDSTEARELEAAGKLNDALKVWTILVRLFPEKTEPMNEMARLSELTRQSSDGETREEEIVSQEELSLRKRVSRYRQLRNEAWDLSDAGKYEDALELISRVKDEIIDRPELLEELLMIEEETRDAWMKQIDIKRKKRLKTILYAIVFSGILGLIMYLLYTVFR